MEALPVSATQPQPGQKASPRNGGHSSDWDFRAAIVCRKCPARPLETEALAMSGKGVFSQVTRRCLFLRSGPDPSPDLQGPLCPGPPVPRAFLPCPLGQSHQASTLVPNQSPPPPPSFVLFPLSVLLSSAWHTHIQPLKSHSGATPSKPGSSLRAPKLVRWPHPGFPYPMGQLPQQSTAPLS